MVITTLDVLMRLRQTGARCRKYQENLEAAPQWIVSMARTRCCRTQCRKGLSLRPMLARDLVCVIVGKPVCGGDRRDDEQRVDARRAIMFRRRTNLPTAIMNARSWRRAAADAEAGTILAFDWY